MKLIDWAELGPLFADGITVVVLFTVSLQRPVTGTVVVPRVCSPVGVLT